MNFNELLEKSGLLHDPAAVAHLSAVEDRKLGWLQRRRLHRANDYLAKAVGKLWMEHSRSAGPVQEQGAIVNGHLDLISGSRQSANYIWLKSGVPHALLRAFEAHCEPLSAIIGKRVSQVTAFAQRATVKRGRVQEPSFRVRMTDPEAEPGSQDRDNIKFLEDFIEEMGFQGCKPPIDERPTGWEPGIFHFLSEFARDSMTMDWATARVWRSGVDPKKYPVVRVSAVDAGRIYRAARIPTDLVNGVVRTKDWEGDRVTNLEPIEFVEQDSPGSTVVSEYTGRELRVMVRNPRSARDSNGYGYSEAESCINAINGWLNTRDYNLNRHTLDSLPRGALMILGNVSEQQLSMFQLQWNQMLAGPQNKFKIPILQANPQMGGDLKWVPFDLSPKDMEYSAFMFMLSCWLHARYNIHPEETGYQALSPFRPPLSEASPEVKLQYSQDTGLSPILRRIADFINHIIVKAYFPSGRYTFEFAGLGYYDEMQDTETRGARLNFGLSTPRMEWNELDQKIPSEIADHPAWDMPMPFVQGVQLLMQLEQAQAMQEQQQMMMQDQQRMQLQAQLGLPVPGMAGEGQPGQGQPGADQEMPPPDNPRPEFGAPQQPTETAQPMQKSVALVRDYLAEGHEDRKRFIDTALSKRRIGIKKRG